MQSTIEVTQLGAVDAVLPLSQWMLRRRLRLFRQLLLRSVLGCEAVTRGYATLPPCPCSVSWFTITRGMVGRRCNGTKSRYWLMKVRVVFCWSGRGVRALSCHQVLVLLHLSARARPSRHCLLFGILIQLAQRRLSPVQMMCIAGHRVQRLRASYSCAAWGLEAEKGRMHSSGWKGAPSVLVPVISAPRLMRTPGIQSC